MLESNNYTMQRVEQMVCECVSSVMEDMNRGGVSCDNVYDGKKNIPLARAIARNFIFDIFHNKYGFSYSVIAQRAGMLTRSVMNCVSKCHNLKANDYIYKQVDLLVDNKFTEWYGKGK